MSDRELPELLEQALRPLQLLDRLDTGGMGEIFLARDPLLRRTVAVKVLRAELAAQQTDRARFFREAEAVAGISHPNVIGIHAVGELADGTPYFVMDYVAGHSLAHRLADSGPFTARDARSVLAQVAAALAAAHNRGVVHRDIKPANILFEPDTGRVLVTDFGVAALASVPVAATGERLTQTGAWVGSPAYMSPEQFLGEPIAPATDVYALGLLAYDLLLGRGPFEATSPQRLLVAHVTETPKPLHELRPDVDPELDALVARCLAKDAAARPVAAEVARVLAPGGEAVIEWPPPGLEQLRGTAYPLARMAGIGCGLLLGPLVLSAHVARNSGSGLVEVLWFIGYLLAAAIGLVALARAGVLFGRMALALREAGNLGYRLGTLAEVLADRRGDTGLLVAGLREYATLAPPLRARLRWMRIVAMAAAVAAPITIPPAALVALTVSRAGSPSVAVLVLLLAAAPALLLVLFGDRSRTREDRLLARARRALARGRTGESARLLVPRWYAAVETLPEATAVPVGRTLPRWAVPALGLAALAGTLGLLLVVGSVAAVLTLGTANRPKQLKVYQTDQKAAPLLALRDLRLPAGSAAAIPSARTLIEQLPSSEVAAAQWRSPRPTDASVEGSVLISGESPWPSPYRLAVDSIIPAAFRELTPAEHAYLQGFSGDPRRETLAALARAPYFELMRDNLLDANTLVLALPMLRFGALREASYVQVGYAGWLISEGRMAEAETALRELVSIGLRLAEDSHMLIDALIGTVVGRVGLRALAQYYAGNGRAGDAGRIRNALQELEGDAEQWQSGGDQMIAELNDTAHLPALRWELLQNLTPATVCTDLRALMRGPSLEVRAAIERARAQLVRRPADSAYFAASVELLERLDRQARRGAAVGAIAPDWQSRNLQRGVLVTSWLLRNPRLHGCFLYATALQ